MRAVEHKGYILSICKIIEMTLLVHLKSTKGHIYYSEEVIVSSKYLILLYSNVQNNHLILRYFFMPQFGHFVFEVHTVLLSDICVA